MTFPPRRHDAPEGSAPFEPPVETRWTDRFVAFRFILPAVKKQNLETHVIGSRLVVSGERTPPRHLGRAKRAERKLVYGGFEREVMLPSGLDTEGIEVEFHHGVLDVRIPYVAEKANAKMAVPVQAPHVLSAVA